MTHGYETPQAPHTELSPRARGRALADLRAWADPAVGGDIAALERWHRHRDACLELNACPFCAAPLVPVPVLHCSAHGRMDWPG